VAAMAPPGGGRNDVTGRFLRHLQVISVDEFDDATMIRIFTAISDWHFSRGFDAVFTRMGRVSGVLCIFVLFFVYCVFAAVWLSPQCKEIH